MRRVRLPKRNTPCQYRAGQNKTRVHPRGNNNNIAGVTARALINKQSLQYRKHRTAILYTYIYTGVFRRRESSQLDAPRTDA